MTSDRYHSMIVTSATDAIIGKTLDGIITSWNVGAEMMYGYSAKEMIGEPVWRLAPPERRGEIMQILERLRSGEYISNFRTKRVRKDGKVIDVSITISPIRDIHGVIVGASTIGRDVTDLVRDRQQRDRRQLVIYLLIMLVGAFGFARTEAVRVRSDQHECRSRNETRSVILTLIDEQVAVAKNTAPPPGSDPALVEAIRRSAQQAEGFSSYAHKSLPLGNCDRIHWFGTY